MEIAKKQAAKGFVNKSSLEMAEKVPKLQDRWRDVVKDKEIKVE